MKSILETKSTLPLRPYRFWDEEFYINLKNEFYSDDTTLIYAELMEEIRRGCLVVGGKYFGKNYYSREDAFADACDRFFTVVIPDMLMVEEKRRKFEAKDTQERKNFFYSVITNKHIDLWRTENRGVVEFPGGKGNPDPDSGNAEESPEKGKRPSKLRDLSLEWENEDGLSIGSLVPSRDDNPLDRMVKREEVFEAFETLFAMENVSTERLLVTAVTILQQVHAYREDGNRVTKDKKLNSEVAEALSKRTAAQNFKLLRALLKEHGLPAELAAPLGERLLRPSDNDDDEMDYTAREVTHIVSDTKTIHQRKMGKDADKPTKPSKKTNNVITMTPNTERTDKE